MKIKSNKIKCIPFKAIPYGDIFAFVALCHILKTASKPHEKKFIRSLRNAPGIILIKCVSSTKNRCQIRYFFFFHLSSAFYMRCNRLECRQRLKAFFKEFFYYSLDKQYFFYSQGKGITSIWQKKNAPKIDSTYFLSNDSLVRNQLKNVNWNKTTNHSTSQIFQEMHSKSIYKSTTPKLNNSFIELRLDINSYKLLNSMQQ